jgi:YD repeat-containing protein
MPRCKKDEENHVTLYGYNPTNQRVSLTEGLAGNCSNPPASASNTPVTRVIEYKYLTPTLDLPTEIKSPSVLGGQAKLTTIGYGNTTPGNPCYGQPLYLPCQITQSGFTPTGGSVTRRVTLGYNSWGQVTSINGPRLPSDPGMNGIDDLTTLEYYLCDTGGRCGQLMKVTNALGHVTTYDTYDANGRVTQLTDPNGLVTVYEYDPRGRVRFIRQTPPGGTTRETSYTYTPWGDVETFTAPDGMRLTYGYDAAHYLRSVTDNAGTGNGNKVTYHYDLKGNRDGEEFRDPDGTLVRSLAYESDLRNHLQQIDAAGSITQLVFDAVGNLTSETDPNGNPATTHTPDPLNRLVNTIDRIGGQTDYAYDVNDRLKTVIAPGTSGNRATTQYVYDDLGNLLKETSPDRWPHRLLL